jgi:hypothetical protein
MPKRTTSRILRARNTVLLNGGAVPHPVVHRGRPDMPPAPTPRISPYVTASWAWNGSPSGGNITWTFVNSDTANSHAVVLYRGGAETPTYIFGGAFWPIYLASGFGFSMLDGTKPIPTLSGGGNTQPMGLLDFGPSASPRYLVAFIFNLAAGQTWSTPEGFTPNAGPTTFLCYALDSNVSGNYCVGYDPARVAQWDSQTGSTTSGYSPNPNNFLTYAFTPESGTPENALGYNDSIAAGFCATKNFYFVTRKNNFGRDEVEDTPTYADAFYLFLEGFTPNAVGSSTPSLSGSFNATSINGLSLPGPTVTYDVGNTGANATLPQRIRFGYGVDFTTASLAAFPSTPTAPTKSYTAQASISILGQPDQLTPQAEFFLLGGEDPYFTNVNANAGNQPYLSQDLRVFTGTPALNNLPVGGAGAPTLSDSVSGAYAYIQNLITWLNQNYGYLNASYTPPDTEMSDPLDTLLPNQSGALYGDSLVNPKTGTSNNYNFAIARVRLTGPSGTAGEAANVKVFFRVFTTQTFDTDFINSASAVTSADPNVTYPSTGSLNDPQSPTAGTDGSGNVNGCSLPFFATANYDAGPTDYNAGGANNQTIIIPGTNDYAWAFFGCFLNVNDATNKFGGQSVQHWFVGAAHSCLVAQIAYNDAPIQNSGGVIESPENSDKLAQRNLQVTTSGNPGFPATHRVPQTIDARPSPPAQSTDPTSILSYPDEMMIDWGKTPAGSVASLYWPAVGASSVLKLAAQLYPEETLTAADANTVQFTVASPVTYIPIPPGAGGSFAGLLTVDLPASVRYGNEFDVVVSRITTRQVLAPTPPPTPPQPKAAQPAAARLALWRYITGSFLMKISVQEESIILPGDENLLAILKWRLTLIDPTNRWYPVLIRWIGYLSGRISGMGGNPSKIPPSQNGYQPPKLSAKHHREHGHTGKVNGVVYDRFGDFEGFHLLTEGGHERIYFSREDEIEELVRYAWAERVVITVLSETHWPEVPVKIILRRVPF